jgi:diacylglycerol kinase family enzyme
MARFLPVCVEFQFTRPRQALPELIHPGAAVSLARGFVADGVGLIVAAGGDGTINEVAEGMIHSHVPLGILPAGTGNVLAAETGLSTNLEKAARNLRTYTPKRISVGRLHFANCVGLAR